jgi:hypothetical protein
MRLTLKIYIFLLVVVIGCVSYKLLDTYTSLKYEVEEPAAMVKSVSELLKYKEHILKDFIFFGFG